ncbi:hypothetical protein ACI7RC_19140 [Brevibacillus sp. B_LB10_24]|uniref:hypothetical protein n=1 Tax=Brevibacillus sp. B_LB10_24 TaxID=3380645 RepID=UPI0038BC1789
MKIILGIVGPEDLVKRVQEQVRSTSAVLIEIKPFHTHLFEEIKQLAKELAESCDILLFTGPGAYELYKSEEAKMNLEMPPVSVYVRYDGSALYRILYELAIESGGDPSRFTPFTIDRLPPDEINETLQEVKLQNEKVIVINELASSSTYDWSDIHEQHFLAGHSKYAITCLTSVANELALRSVPVKRVVPTYSSIQSALQIVYAKVENLVQSQSQMAVILLKWRLPDRRPKNRFSAYRANLKLQESIIDFCESWEASLTFSTDNQAIIYTTMSVVKEITNNFRYFPLIQSLGEQTGNKVFAGIGIGMDALKAEYNAEQAIQFTDAKANPCAYVMFTDGQLLGPLLQSDRMPLKFSTSADHPALLKLAEQTNLSAVTLTRLLSLQSHHPRADISVHHVAKAFDISLRSARRLLRQIETSGLARVVGEEQPPGRGRPRQLYRLSLPEELYQELNK